MSSRSQISGIRKRKFKSGGTRYCIAVKHVELCKYREIRGTVRRAVEQKAKAQARRWDEQWGKREAKERDAKEALRKQAEAKMQTEAAQKALQQIADTLTYSLDVNDEVVWDSLKDRSRFAIARPKKPKFPPRPLIPKEKDFTPKPSRPEEKDITPKLPRPGEDQFPVKPLRPEEEPVPPKPQISNDKYKPNPTFLDSFVGSIRQARLERAKAQFQTDLVKWQKRRDKILERNRKRKQKHERVLQEWEAKKLRLIEEYKANLRKWEAKKLRLIEKYEDNLRKWESKKLHIMQRYETDVRMWESKKLQMMWEYESALSQWEARKKKFRQKQNDKNRAIDDLRKRYQTKQRDAVVPYCDLVLTHSNYPDTFPQTFHLDHNPETRILIVDYSLPNMCDLPMLKEVRYIKSRDEFKEILLSDREMKKLYDSLLYQISLRTLHELYEADVVEAIELIVFNGWVKSIDRATGHEVNACILSIQASQEEFYSLNLSLVEPKDCFKKLKGVGSSKLHSLAPVAPIINIDNDDSRFVSSYDVAETLDDSENIAAMPWEDFEHLVRELFEKEFSQGGGEVKITQASRDGGVDAVAFDPDPIRGGKIVIQAKRYTNVVGVTAVRDLYGTVISEGATKGILITTAYYGPDAYNFAKGKPLTLLDGSNLLHLLAKCGYKARIDLKEARMILAEQQE